MKNQESHVPSRSRSQKQKEEIDHALKIAIITALPAIILAGVELLKTGRALGWW